MYINNVGSLIQALSQHDEPNTSISSVQATHVSFISLTNCIGRVMMGVLSDLFGQFGVPRIIFVILGALIVLVAQILLSCLNSRSGLIVATPFLGIGYGSVFGSTPALVSEYFGLEYFGSNWGWFQWVFDFFNTF